MRAEYSSSLSKLQFMEISYEAIDSGDYRAHAQEWGEFEEKVEQAGQELPEEVKSKALLFKERAKVLKEVEDATGLKFDVAQRISQPRVAAFVKTDNWKAFMGEHTLDNREMALHAAHHEKEHTLNKISHVPVELLAPKERKILDGALGEEFKSVDLVEGFNDWSTQDKHGEHSGSGYNIKEVPMAKKLEDLGRKHRVGSFLETFRAGDPKRLVEKMQLLAAKIHFEEGLARVA